MTTFGTPWLGIAFFGIVFCTGMIVAYLRTDGILK